MVLPAKIRKRDGRIVEFDVSRIRNSIYKAMIATNVYTKENLEKVVKSVLKVIEEVYGPEGIPAVEEIQDIIEVELMKHGFFKTAKAYILYRKEKAKIRQEKAKIWGIKANELDWIEKRFSINALRVLASRYPARDETGKILERPRDIFARVAVALVLAEILYDPRVYDKDGKQERKEFDYLGWKERINQYDRVFGWGEFRINKYHFERLLALYKELNEQKKMRVNFDTILEMLERGDFNYLEPKVREYFMLMANQVAMPNTPAIVNAGRPLGMLSACFVVPIEDDMVSIMKAATDMALIQKAGGGTGFNFSFLRPKGDIVKSTTGVASGPVSFMRIFDIVSDVIKQGGVRRGANMGIMEVWHPDIREFVRAKEKEGVFETFNLSVAFWANFFDHLLKGEPFPLVNPRNGEIVAYEDPEELFREIAYYAWLTADPGVLFFDIMNKRNVLKEAKGGLIRWTNPCGEEPLYPYESCNLMSINVSSFVKEDEEGKPYFDWDEFHRVTRLVTRALDNMISVNKYPIEEIDRATKLTRRIGVGLMGVAQAMFKLGIRYNSKEGFDFLGKLCEHLTYYAYVESVELAKERGPFPLFEKSAYVKGEMPIEGYYHREKWTLPWDELIDRIKRFGLRNAMVTTNPPTGSVSMICDTSSGIEPVFSLVFEKVVTVGRFFYIDPVFKETLEKRGIYSDELIEKIAKNYGSVQGIEEVPEDIKRVFVTALDIHWLDHIVAQATAQFWITDSISKTINMPNDVTVEDVMQAYLIAHELGCKGVTIYRDGSKSAQVLVTVGREKRFELRPSKYALKLVREIIKKKPELKRFITVLEDVKKEKPEKKPMPGMFIKIPEEKVKKVPREEVKKERKAKKCPVCGNEHLVYQEGCVSCPVCGWSACLG